MNVLSLALTVIISAVIGSFINCMAYRAVHPEHPASNRSCCPNCHTTIVWYDLIPILSWLWLRGKCRGCSKPISWLYPTIELFAILCGVAIVTYIIPLYWFSTALFCSALLFSIRTDIDTMLLSRFATLALVPVMFLLSLMGLSPIGLAEAVIGALFGFGVMWLFAWVFEKAMGKKGLGEGDFDLMCFIGSYLGAAGVWFTLLIGSLVGSCLGIALIASGLATRSDRVPFAPFLALGALITLFNYQAITAFIFCTL